jgi:LysR family nitrogen assimilation transcriptional regulator
MTNRPDATLLDIRLFVAAVEERSFTRAAIRENATQSGVSQHIRKLERRFGVDLFVRCGTHVVPTPAGQAYYRECLEVLRRYDIAQEVARSFAGDLSGEIRIGLMPTMTRSALAPALAVFTETYRNVHVRVIEAFSAALSQLVAAGELDFAVVPALQEREGVRSTRFLRTPEILVSGSHCRNRHLQPVRLADVAPLKLVLPGSANARRHSLAAYCQANQVTIARLIELDAMFGTIDFVERTDWSTILPGIMVVADIHRPGLTLNPITDPPLWLDLALIEPQRRSLSKPAHAFHSILLAESIRLNAEWQKAPVPGW